MTPGCSTQGWIVGNYSGCWSGHDHTGLMTLSTILLWCDEITAHHLLWEKLCLADAVVPTARRCNWLNGRWSHDCQCYAVWSRGNFSWYSTSLRATRRGRMMDVVLRKRWLSRANSSRLGRGLIILGQRGEEIFYEFHSSGWPMRPFREAA